VPFARAIILPACRPAPAPFELLLDAEGVGGGACPEFPQGMAIALAPADQSLMVFPALAEEGDDAVSELSRGARRRGRGVEPVDDERAMAHDPFEAFARRPFRGGLGGMQGERRLFDFFAHKGVADFAHLQELKTTADDAGY
jgi:hypothetical protein